MFDKVSTSLLFKEPLKMKNKIKTSRMQAKEHELTIHTRINIKLVSL